MAALVTGRQRLPRKGQADFDTMQEHSDYLQSRIELLEVQVDYYSKQPDGEGKTKASITDAETHLVVAARRERDHALAKLKAMADYDATLTECNLLRDQVEHLIAEKDAAVQDLQTIIGSRDVAAPLSDGFIPESKAELTSELAFNRHALRSARNEYDNAMQLAQRKLVSVQMTYHSEVKHYRDEERKRATEIHLLGKSLDAALHAASEAEADRHAADLQASMLNKLIANGPNSEQYRATIMPMVQIANLQRQLEESHGLERKAARLMGQREEKSIEDAKKLRMLERKVKEMEWEKDVNVKSDSIGIKIGRRDSNAGDREDYDAWLGDIQVHVAHLPSGIEAASRLKGPLFEWIKELRDLVAAAPDPTAFETPKDNEWIAKLSETIEKGYLQIRHLREKSRSLAVLQKRTTDEAAGLARENLHLRSRLEALHSGHDPKERLVSRAWFDGCQVTFDNLARASDFWRKQLVAVIEGDRAGVSDALRDASIRLGLEEAKIPDMPLEDGAESDCGVCDEVQIHDLDGGQDEDVAELEEEHRPQTDIQRADAHGEMDVRRGNRASRNPQPQYVDGSGDEDMIGETKRGEGKKRRREEDVGEQRLYGRYAKKRS